jgi:pimeloyl-ACP methyl ester carboxylesterase
MLDEKLFVELGGLKQKIHIRTEDESRPVLLFLHGGPGVINRHAIMTAHKDLVDTFTLACWDQRGSGGSYYNCPEETLTIERVTDDAAELVEWLCKRFKKDKIFIIGGSWGSELGTWLSYRYPARLAAYVGFGQVVDGAKNEEISYSFTLKAAKEAGDLKSVKALEELGPPVKGEYKGGFKGMMIQRNIMMKHGGYSKSAAKRSYFDSMVKPMLLSGEYSIRDMIGTFLGYKRVLTKMWPMVAVTDLARTCPEFQIPYFIFDGRLDYNTPAELVEDYFAKVKAPKKELVWFDNSGHNPMSDEPEKFKPLLREKLIEIAKSEKEKGIAV